MTQLDRFRLDDKVAVVTGASSGLGVAFAAGLAEAGADVVVCARRAERLEETRAHVAALWRRCLAVPADVRLVEDCRRVVGAAMDAVGASTCWSTTPARARPFRSRARPPPAGTAIRTSSSARCCSWPATPRHTSPACCCRGTAAC